MLGFFFDFGYINVKISFSESAVVKLWLSVGVVLDMVMPL